MDVRYPIGKFEWAGSQTAEERSRRIDEIATVPAGMHRAVAGLSAAQLDTPYREGGWTIRQVAHHVPDSHMNSYIRFKFALTENEPTIKPYDEAQWAELIDARSASVGPSLSLLEGLHGRWTILLRSLSTEEVNRKLLHPEIGVLTIDEYIARVAWHGAHHIAHITSLRQQKGW